MADTSALTVTFEVDVRPFMAAMANVTKALAELDHEATRLRAAGRRFWSSHRLTDRRARHGGNSSEAADPQWQSTVCAGLLCSVAPCPSDTHSLHCTCTCHRKAHHA